MSIQLEMFPEGTDYSLYRPSKRLYDGLRQYFNMYYDDKLMECFGYCDGLMTAMMGRPIINIINFNKYLSVHHCLHTVDHLNLSMSDVVIMFYGSEADKWLTKYLY